MANPTTQTRSDPIRDNYFTALEAADTGATWLFYIVAFLSIAVLFVEKPIYPRFYNWINVVFSVLVIGLFFVGLIIRLYLTPRAEDKRRQEFFSKACGVPLTHEATTGYYNNAFTEPIKRVAAQTLENSFFSKTIALKMLHRERWVYSLYATVWLIAVFNRGTDIALIVVIAQTLFSEQLISRWLRLEWARSRFEDTYSNLYRLFQTGTSDTTFLAHTLEFLTTYETSKANGGITLSSAIFEKHNGELSMQWETIKKTLGI